MQNNKNHTVVVAMSGGVDSSVAAALLLEQGYKVIGVTMKTYEFDDVGGNVANETSCCGLGAMNDARMVASQLGIPHYVVDFRKAFGKEVIDNFVAEYLRGRTPNPCIICNREIKWGELLRKADALGADFIATGHYAQVRFNSERKRYVVSQSLDLRKDQSYALWALSQQALSRTMFPLGAQLKKETRRLAEQFGLRTASKRESYEICFVPDNKYERFLKERVPQLETEVVNGDIVWEGKVVGRHRGYPFYTVGQRKGIGAYGEPVYVTQIESETNTVHIGREEDLLQRELVAENVNFIGIERLENPLRVDAAVRYKDVHSPATLYPLHGGAVRVVFDEPKKAITPGQSVVFYEGSDVLGGGVIDRIAKTNSP
ncbi:MAG: tRNA 2-thiouridine(34) synthase MnmA [Ignavibacteriae bacterium]|nr:tRNA 2-thiouridine(34) synthase MnmA [Ignavibacteriota bacterium]